MTAPKPDGITDREPRDYDALIDGNGDLWQYSESTGEWRCPQWAREMPFEAIDDPQHLYTIRDLAARDEAVRREVLAPFKELFGGGPDTPCRTTWHPTPWAGVNVECVEVPMDDLRAAFTRAEATPHADDTEAGS